MSQKRLLFLAALVQVGLGAECSQSANECYHNPQGLIFSSAVSGASACCDLCHATTACASWTFFGGNTCNLFKDIGTVHSGDCTSGRSRVQPNILFWFPDTVRAESVGGPFGHPLVKTPWYDALAANGTAFRQCHALHTQCAPSRHAMVTGRYLHTTGHRTQTHAVQTWEPNLFKYLKDAGYSNWFFGKNDVLSADAVNQSLSYWSGPASGNKAAASAAEFINGTLGDISQYPDNQRAWDAVHSHRVASFMASKPREPWFLFVPTNGAHPPYSTHDGPGFPFGEAGYYSFYDGGSSSYDPAAIKDQAPLRPSNVPNKPRYITQIPEFRNLTSLQDDFFYRLNAAYLTHVSQTDTNFGTVMSALQAQPDMDGRTAVFIGSDHGDFGGDYHLVEKWPGSMDDVLTRVPLIARMPPNLAQYQHAPKGQVVDAQVQLFDVMPTFLQLAGVAPKHTHFAQSLLGVINGTVQADEERVVFSEGGYLYPTEIEPLHGGGGTSIENEKDLYYPRALNELWNCSLLPANWEETPNWAQCHGSPRAVMMRTPHYKLVYRPNGVSELYDLADDVRELHNLYEDAAHSSVVSELQRSLLKWFLVTSDVTPLHEDPRGLPPKPPVPPTDM